MSETLFISDLHLDKERPQIIEQFLDFLNNDTHDADALYILGDLFEYWIGDDDPAEGLTAVIRELRTATERGLPIYFVHGNRDFLIGHRFCLRTGIHLLEDYRVIDLYGIATLIMHGDTLCTDDLAYQSLRWKTRNRLIQWLLLRLSLKTRQQIARYLHSKSTQEKQSKSEAIMDVNQSAVEQAMRKHRVNRLIHGHTHRPAIHQFELDGEEATRIVLGDWYTHGAVLRVDAGGYRFRELM